MNVYATIPSRLVRISGEPNSSWGPASANDENTKELPFSFEITDDGNRNYLFVYHSTDNVYCADTWHETLEDAHACAEAMFGIRRREWSRK